MSDRYREHRVRSSLDHVTGRSVDEEHVRDMAAAVYREGRGVYFSAEQLAAMNWDIAELIKTEAKKLYGRRYG